jgi:SNF2 family DNA or RNA helicase
MPRELMVHQENALKYASNKKNPAFFMEMRLGKTLVTIRWVQQLQEKISCCLVIAPLTVLEAWKRELTFENEPYIDLHSVVPSQRDTVLKEEVFSNKTQRVWVLINYESVVRTPLISGVAVRRYQIGGKRKTAYSLIQGFRWDVVILDESTKIKNVNSKVTQVCCRGFRDTKHRVILTGLPAPENELELFTQFQFLNGTFLGFDNFYRFKTHYYEPSLYNRYKWLPKKGTSCKIKEEVHRLAFVLLRSQVNLGSKKIFHRRHVEMSSSQKKMYNSVVKDYAYQLKNGQWEETQWAMIATLWLQRLTGGFSPDAKQILNTAKAREIVDLLDNELSQQQVVVWYKFRTELDLTVKVLKENNISCATIDGDVSQQDREKAIREFREGKVRVLLATEKCAKMGIDCSNADCAIYYSNEWSCDDRLQSEDRILHPSKKSPLLFIDLVTKGTIDEEVVERVRYKSFDAKELMIQRLARSFY